ncbi:hypothetical protein AVEN_191518-1 [Araneus ventricosus]|uniref:Uncharacterized protein n=1 Tax=Araneus ventricosus TaxID=182803 RepID=A0A4Y2NF72_ARAVE|nr:hypothetical protein AVEN_191518-1 [Araneus ventricosus]
MYDATVSHAFSISLIASEDCCFAVTFSFSDKLSSTSSCCETQCNSVNFGGQLLAVLFHNLIDIIVIHCQSHDIGQRLDLVGSRLKYLKVTLGNAHWPKFLPSRSEGSLGNSFPCIFDQLEAGNNIEVIFQKLSEREIGS